MTAPFEPATNHGRGDLAAPAAGPRILYAADEDGVRETNGSALAQAGFAVTLVFDGTTAWAAVDSGLFQLAVVDQEMSGLSGWEVFAKARQKGSSLPFIIVSDSNGAHPHPAHRWQEPAFLLLRKPFSGDTLVARVRQVLDAGARLAETNAAPARAAVNPPRPAGRDQRPFAALLVEAEALVRTAAPAATVPPATGELARLAHALHVHQVALGLQHEDLRFARQELQATRDQLASIHRLAPLGSITLDPDGKVLDANLAAAALLGVEPHDLPGRKLSTLLVPDDAERFDRHRRSVFGSGRRAGCELRIVSADGGPRPVRLESIAFADPEGRLSQCLTVIADLGEKSDEWFREIAENIDHAVCIHDANGGIQYLSPAFERVWGRSEPELRGNPGLWLDAVHPQDRERLARFRADDPGPFEEEYRILLPDGGTRWVRERGFRVRSKGDGAPRRIAALRDITESKQLEARLGQIQKMEAVGSFASGIVHDFKNLLMGIQGCAELALLEEVSLELRSRMVDIRDAAARGSTLVNSLLTFTRRQGVDPRPVEVERAIDASLGLVRSLIGEHVRLQFEARAPQGMVMADPVQLEQILLNLASNAGDAMPEGGTLTIRTEDADLDIYEARRLGLAAAGRCIRLVVTDTGCGMSESTKARLFEPFFTTKGDGKGTGLGLATVFAVVRQLNGHIVVESEPGCGTAFTIHLPALADAQPEAAPPQATDPRLAVSGRGRTVLVVEDEPLVRLTVGHHLRVLGFNVLEAESPANALALVAQGGKRLDLVITDLMMPGMSGRRMTDLLGERSAASRFLFMSAWPADELARRGLIESGSFLLVKPFNRDSLADKVREVLEA